MSNPESQPTPDASALLPNTERTMRLAESMNTAMDPYLHIAKVATQIGLATMAETKSQEAKEIGRDAESLFLAREAQVGMAEKFNLSPNDFAIVPVTFDEGSANLVILATESGIKLTKPGQDGESQVYGEDEYYPSGREAWSNRSRPQDEFTFDLADDKLIADTRHGTTRRMYEEFIKWAIANNISPLPDSPQRDEEGNVTEWNATVLTGEMNNFSMQARYYYDLSYAFTTSNGQGRGAKGWRDVSYDTPVSDDIQVIHAVANAASRSNAFFRPAVIV